jgi:protein-tyrosine kinase
MSLVEQALKKLQASRGGLPPPQTPPVRPGAASAAPPPAAPVVRSSRVVAINREHLRASGVLPLQQEERQIVQQFRQIKRPLVANAFGRGAPQVANGQIIMLASALPGDGKTFTSFNLALSLALEKDVNTILVDADVAKPHISRLLGVEGEQGLLDVLRDPALDVESVLLDSDVPNLTILPCGRPSDTATELLASPRMQDVAARLVAADPTRIVLLDTPPLLLTSESRALTSVAGQVVLVVAAGSTPQKAVFDALDMLGDGKQIGIVLNQSNEGSLPGYYGYYGRSENTNKEGD